MAAMMSASKVAFAKGVSFKTEVSRCTLLECTQGTLVVLRCTSVPGLSTAGLDQAYSCIRSTT